MVAYNEYRGNKPLFPCPTHQHLLAPHPCPHEACLSAVPACQGWLLVRPPGWPPARHAAHHAGSQLRPAAAQTGANGWELVPWGGHAETVDNALAHAETCGGAETGTHDGTASCGRCARAAATSGQTTPPISMAKWCKACGASVYNRTPSGVQANCPGAVSAHRRRWASTARRRVKVGGCVPVAAANAATEMH